MAEQESRKSGGGKLARSEIVTVRLDPKLRYIAELAARRQRRTLSSFIEWAVEKALSDVTLRTESDWQQTLLEAAPKLWAFHPVERFLRLATQFPELLSYEEEAIWDAIQTTVAVQVSSSTSPNPATRSVTFLRHDRSPDIDLVKACWEKLGAFVAGEASAAELQTALIDADESITPAF